MTDEWLRDARLSGLAKWTMACLLTRQPGVDHMSAEWVSTTCKDGERAIQTAIKQLKAYGYYQSWGVTREGKHKTLVLVYPNGGAPSGEGPAPELPADMPDPPAPVPALPGPATPDPAPPDPGNRVPVGTFPQVRPERGSAGPVDSGVVVVVTTTREEDESSSITRQHQVEDPRNRVPVDRRATPSNFPVPAREMLVEQFGQNTVADGQRWQSAWEAAGQPEDYDTSVHLMHYLLKCQQTGHTPGPGTWLGFLHDNREQHRQKMALQEREADRAVREHEKDKAHTLDLRNHTFEVEGYADYEAELKAAWAAKQNGTPS
jgi:hypothetical protein